MEHCTKCCYIMVPFLLIFFACSSGAQVEDASPQLYADSLEWPVAMSLYDGGYLGGGIDVEELEEVSSSSRRSLFWYRARHYISYAALSANRIPCPPRSGRSYYTRNCYFASAAQSTLIAEVAPPSLVAGDKPFSVSRPTLLFN